MTRLGRLKLIQSASIGGILLLIACGASAAPLCSEVLRDNESLIHAIQNLAQMKMDADINQIQGSAESLGIHMVHEQFDKKLAEVLDSISNENSRTQVTAQIKKEIARLQIAKDGLKEQETRQVEQETLVNKYIPPTFERTEKVSFNHGNTQLAYSSATDQIILSFPAGFIKTMKFASEEAIHFGDDMFAPKVLPNGKQIISYSKDGAIRVHDLATGAEISSKKAPAYHDTTLLGAFSPQNKYFARTNRTDTISIVDVATGKEIRSVERKALSDSDGAILKMKYVAEDRILICLHGIPEQTWVLYDFANGFHQAVKARENSAVTVSVDGKTIFIVYDKTYQYDSKDLSLISVTDTKPLDARRGVIAEAIPNSQYHIIASRDDTSQPFAFISDISTDVMMPSSNLNGHYFKQKGMPVNLPQQIIFSENGQFMIVQSLRQIQNGGSIQLQIEKWERKQSKN